MSAITVRYPRSGPVQTGAESRGTHGPRRSNAFDKAQAKVLDACALIF